MSDASRPPTVPGKSRRHALLFQRRLSEQVFWPSIAIVALSAALLIWSPEGLDRYRPGLRLGLAAAGLLLIGTLVFRVRAYVQCRPEGLRIQAPFHQLTIPYHEIQATRPTELYRMFPASKERWTQQHFLQPLFGETVVVVEMDELPAPRLRLRLWFTKYMLCPDRIGLVLAVPDWMALRSDLDEFIARSRRP